MIYLNMGHGDLVMSDFIQNQLIEDALLWIGTNVKQKSN